MLAEKFFLYLEALIESQQNPLRRRSARDLFLAARAGEIAGCEGDDDPICHRGLGPPVRVSCKVS
jgi:hypothetical protein